MLGQEPIEGSTVISLVNGGLEDFTRAVSFELPGIRINAISPTFVKETMDMMGMDSSTGMPAADLGTIYQAVLEGDCHGKILDVRTFS